MDNGVLYKKTGSDPIAAILKAGSRKANGNNTKQSKQTKITDFCKTKSGDKIKIEKYDEIDITKVKFHHLNSNRREQSMDLVEKETSKHKSFIHFGQEPHCKLNIPTGLNKGHRRICIDTDRPQAFIYHS